MEWLRLYSNIVNDPKIMTMPEKYRWRYVALLCLFRINSDSFPTESDILFSMRIKKQEWELTKNEFEKRGLILEDTINGWTTRQYKSDDGYERVKRFRNKNETLQNGKQTVTETPPETETETETETEREIPPNLIELSKEFHSFQNENHPTLLKKVTKNMINNGAIELDKLIRIDKYSIEEIERVLDFIKKDNFWCKNILSLCGIRKKSASGLIKFANAMAQMPEKKEIYYGLKP